MKITLAVLCALELAASVYAESVDTILARMDKESQSFHAMSADVQMTTYTAIISDKSVEDGTLKVQRQKSSGQRAVIDFPGENKRTIEFLGNIVRILYPKTKLYQDIDVGKNSDVLNQFLLLGFGSSGKELMESYEIAGSGEEKIGSQETTKLVLTPKSGKVKERLNKIEVWILNGSAYPLQQKFYEPSGNYRIVLYNDVKINPSIKGNLELRVPSGYKKQGAESR